MRFRSYFVFLLVTATMAGAFGGCGGRLAKTGYATITDVAPSGAVRIQYAEGKADWKQMECDNVLREVRIAQRNRGKPARIVETKNGGTITFPEGDTVTFHDLH